MLGPLPKEAATQGDRTLTRTWQVYLNNMRNQLDFGIPPSSDTDITAAAGINITTKHMRIQSGTAGAIVITANPQINPSNFDGDNLLVEGLDDIKTVSIANGNGIVLKGSSPFVIGKNDIISFTFNKKQNVWIEKYRN